MKQTINSKKSVLYLLLIFHLVSFTFFAQENDTLIETKQHFSYNKNHIAIGTNDIVRGCFIAHYEHVFMNRFGVEIGAGFTFDDWYALRYGMAHNIFVATNMQTHVSRIL